ncbi:uncharacterized protein PHACADRAFT_33999 [Phanerochaete carnosa HHB-10118-sp]|uniref:Uncharacterized protein n=1 Tax=Phanerochaete carnosa (strain HHB-10118-sp) TaxID=650164 RepID=K5VN95_PHACS|nr:uncharacterized protein PHACADRAFT_33999 [Phanerochaete carnosa HHB-10118-sp]EKM48165.1 hypothetical protein PHACADRAFT_33999 [Phanerochaete carnosa HHB-10118-sp]
MSHNNPSSSSEMGSDSGKVTDKNAASGSEPGLDQSGNQQICNSQICAQLQNPIDELLSLATANDFESAPEELTSFEEAIIKASQKSAVLFDLWSKPNVFVAKRHPTIDIDFMACYTNESSEKKAQQAEIFNAMPNLTLRQN